MVQVILRNWKKNKRRGKFFAAIMQSKSSPCHLLCLACCPKERSSFLYEASSYLGWPGSGRSSEKPLSNWKRLVLSVSSSNAHA